MEHVIFLLLCRLPARTARRDPLTGEWVLAYARLWLLVPVLVTGVFLVIAAHPEVMNRPAGVNPARPPRQIPAVAVVAVALGFALLGIACLAEMLGTSARLGEHSIVGQSPWRWPVTIPWDGLTRITYSGRGDALSLWGADGSKIKVSFMMSGMRTLHDELGARLDPAVFRQARPFFDTIGMRRPETADREGGDTWHDRGS